MKADQDIRSLSQDACQPTAKTEADVSGARYGSFDSGVRRIAELGQFRFSAEFVSQVPIAFARRHRMIGLAGSDPAHIDTMELAVAELGDLQHVQAVGRLLRRDVMPVLADAQQILAAINSAYEQRTGQAQTLLENLDREAVLGALEPKHGDDLLDDGSRAPVVKLVNLVLFEAVQALASDVHIQPYLDRLVVRMRIDGILYDSLELPKGLQDEIVSRVKIMGRMNIAEKRLPQDGRSTVRVGDRMIDLRVSTVPASVGERVVIRLLDKSVRLYSLPELGMAPSTLERFRSLIAMDHGIVLVTGPTGSGKTTTLYAALQEINRKEQNIITLEDPIEYGLDGISQIQVSDRKGMTFASGLRSVLRQDPDIIMVGEIRDRETAAMAIQSALTGHLVFSTLHTNDAASAVTRLLDLGIEPYLLASSIVGVLAQRLVRRVCAECAADVVADPLDLRKLSIDAPLGAEFLMRLGRGCAKCRNTGYSGRLGLFELLMVDEPVRRLVARCATASEIKQVAVAGGMVTLREDGISKVGIGRTTVDEVLRVTMRATV